ncbi:hypothetical protein BCR34DRAFT_632827, partial [Clohesyomyces aquaticus]
QLRGGTAEAACTTYDKVQRERWCTQIWLRTLGWTQDRADVVSGGAGLPGRWATSLGPASRPWLSVRDDEPMRRPSQTVSALISIAVCRLGGDVGSWRLAGRPSTASARPPLRSAGLARSGMCQVWVETSFLHSSKPS